MGRLYLTAPVGKNHQVSLTPSAPYVSTTDGSHPVSRLARREIVPRIRRDSAVDMDARKRIVYYNPTAIVVGLTRAKAVRPNIASVKAPLRRRTSVDCIRWRNTASRDRTIESVDNM